MYKLFLVFTITFSLNAFAQNNCGCEGDYRFTVSYIERNLPGFGDNVSDSNRVYYEHFRDSLMAVAVNASYRNDCFEILNAYVEYFNDSHTTIRNLPIQIVETDTASLNKFYQSKEFIGTKTFVINEQDLAQRPLESLEGIYFSRDSTYKIGITQAPLNGQYYGVIIASKTKTWKAGQVKLELTLDSLGNYGIKTLMRNHSESIEKNVTVSDGNIFSVVQWVKAGASVKKVNAKASGIYSFSQLNDKANYIKVSSFSGNLFSELDSFYKAISPMVFSKPYLIIDVRDNGGGSTNCVLPLISFFYSKKIIDTTWAQHYSTPDIIARYEEEYAAMRKNIHYWGKANVENFGKELNQLKSKQPYTYFPNKGTKQRFTFTKHKFPLKVAILYNRGCASACEDLIFFAKHPSKAILMGEDSGGYVGYGNVFPLKTPCFGFMLNCTTTRISWNQRQFEGKGIPPSYYLSNDKDWVSQALEIIMEK